MKDVSGVLDVKIVSSDWLRRKDQSENVTEIEESNIYSPRMICSVGHQLAPLDENRISGILGAGPGRVALAPLVELR